MGREGDSWPACCRYGTLHPYLGGILRIEELREVVREALVREGMHFGLTPDQADDALRALVGDKRYLKFCRTMDRVRRGAASIHSAYLQFDEVRSANCLMSAQAEIALACTAAAVERSGLLEMRAGRVGELGCHAGTVLRALARLRPELQFRGFDRHKKLMKAAQFAAPTNCTFRYWDYAAADPNPDWQCDVLFGSLCIDYEEGAPILLGEDWRAATIDRFAHQSSRCLANWQRLTVDGGRAAVVLRLPHLEAFVGACLAAVETGWEIDHERCALVEAAQEKFPLLVLRAGDVETPTPDLLSELVRTWQRIQEEVHSEGDPEAQALVR